MTTRTATSFVYLIANQGIYKIGKSDNPQARLATVASDGELLHVIPSLDPYTIERALHRRFAAQGAADGPGREWFHLSPEDIDAICRLARVDAVDDLPPELQPQPVGKKTTIKISCELLRDAKIVAAMRRIDLCDYIDSILRPAVERDYEAAVMKAAQMLQPPQEGTQP